MVILVMLIVIRRRIPVATNRATKIMVLIIFMQFCILSPSLSAGASWCLRDSIKISFACQLLPLN